MMRKKRLLMLFGAALVLLAVLAWTQGSQSGYFGHAARPASAAAADPKDEACQEGPCGVFDRKETPCIGGATCGKLLDIDIDGGPCNGSCGPVDPNLGPCNGPCRPVDINVEPCRGPCRELDLPVDPVHGSGQLPVQPGLRRGH